MFWNIKWPLMYDNLVPSSEALACPLFGENCGRGGENDEMIQGNGVPVIQTLVIRPTSADSWALSAVFPF